MLISQLKSRLVLFVAIYILLQSTIASAYILKGPHILELMTTRLGKLKKLTVTQTLKLFSKNDQGEIAESAFKLDETLYYDFINIQFRSDIVSEERKRIHVFSSGNAVTVIDDKITSETENLFDYYKDVLLYRSRKSIQNQLLNFKIDTNISSFGRFLKKIVYIIGAKYPDETVPQLWVDKETFLPVRWIIHNIRSSGHQEILEIRYLKWQPIEGSSYPKRIEFYHNDSLVHNTLLLKHHQHH